MSTPSKCCAHTNPAGWLLGALALVGIAAVAVALLRGHEEDADPMDEVERRIASVEHSLHRLQDTFHHTARR
jgi:hypothetical protein